MRLLFIVAAAVVADRRHRRLPHVDVMDELQHQLEASTNMADSRLTVRG